MDYRKLDAALAAALADDEPAGPASAGVGGAPRDPRRLSVFVHVDREVSEDVREDRQEELMRLGLRPGALQGGIGTATLSPSQVAELSEQPWVRSIRLSQPLRALEEE